MEKPHFEMFSFLPLRTLGTLHAKTETLPASISLTGTVLMIDVSRYTALVETLARRGQLGLEQIPRLLNQSYASSTATIASHGGEVLRFSGDAVIAFWPSEHFGAASSVRRAMACAAAICDENSQSSDATETTGELAIHAGIGFGEVWAAAVGGRPVWNLLFGGDAVSQASDAQHRAQGSDFLLSDQASTLFETMVPKDIEQDGNADGSSVAGPPYRWLRGFLPQRLQETVFLSDDPLSDYQSASSHDVAGTDAIESKLLNMSGIRPISALFARIVGDGSRTWPSEGRLQSLCVDLQKLLADHDCPAGELFIDDKGLVFSVSFGEHGKFHRDDPQRAVETAHAMHAVIRDHQFRVSIGVATGDAVFQVVGSTERRQWMAIGQTVNRAARLMTEIEDGILCDAPTERAARGAFSFERRGTVQLLGLSDVTPVFQPLARTPVAPKSAPIIGRRRELDALRSAFDDARSGASKAMVVIGEPGIGKTTLANAFVTELAEAGHAATISSADREVQRASMRAWQHVLAFLVGSQTNSAGSAIFDAIKSRTQDIPDIAERLPLLGDVLGVPVAATPLTKHLDGARQADATMRLLANIIDQLAPRPLTLVLEDCQWLDSASWRLVEWVLGTLDSLLIVLCVRAGEIPDELAQLMQKLEPIHQGAGNDLNRSSPSCETLRLMELDDASVGALVARALGGAPPGKDISDKVTQLAGGNPFFAEEIALSLKNQGLISIRDGYWRSGRSLAGLTFFEGVERVIRESVDRLDAAAQNVLRTASVIGRRFSIDALEALGGGDLGTMVNRLADAHLIKQGTDQGLYEFRHVLIRDVVYYATPSEIRQQLHGALARWIESKTSAAKGADVSILVQHFEAAHEFDHAVKYADLAATNAEQVGAFREVEAFIRICIEHEPPKRLWSTEEWLRAVRWRRQLAEAHYHRGDIRAQGIAIRKALDVAGHPVPTNRARILLGLIARGALIYLRQKISVVRDYLDKTDAEEREAEIARCLGQAATVDYFELRFARGMYNLLGAVLHAERTGVSIDTSIASAQLASGFGMLRLRKANTQLMKRAEQVAIELDDPSTHSHVCTLDALWHLGHCEWQQVDRRLDQAQELASKAGDKLRWCNAQGIRFWSQYYRGDLGRLEETALALLSQAQNAGNMQQEIWALRCKALCMLHIDRPREAVDVLRMISSGAPRTFDLAAEISVKGALALGLARLGNHAESFDLSVETMQLLEKIKRPPSHVIIVGIASVLEVLLRGRDIGISDGYDEWRSLERKAFGHLRRYCKVFEIGHTQLGLWTGLDAWLGGHRKRAFSTWHRTLADAQRLSLRKDETLLLAEIRRRDHLEPKIDRP